MRKRQRLAGSENELLPEASQEMLGNEPEVEEVVAECEALVS